MIPNIVMEVAMKEGQKAGAKVVSKLVTSVTAALISNKAMRLMNKNDKPIVLYAADKRDAEIRKRIIRDSTVGASITLIGTAIHMIAGNVIEQTDI